MLGLHLDPEASLPSLFVYADGMRFVGNTFYRELNRVLGENRLDGSSKRSVGSTARMAAAAQRSAMLYSLLGTCKLHGHNPFDWLLDVINRLTDGDPDLDACLPNRWKPKPPAHFKRAA